MSTGMPDDSFVKISTWKASYSSTEAGGVGHDEGATKQPGLGEFFITREFITNFSGTLSAEDVRVGSNAQVEPSVERLYPQFYDESTAGGRAIGLVMRALSDARKATASYERGDVDAVGSCLATIALIMRDAQEHTGFNEDFGALVSFLRRATLVASPAEVSLSSLNALVGALAALSENPAIDLNAAAEIADGLSEEGWRGDHELVVAMMKALLDEEAADEVQSELFEEV